LIAKHVGGRDAGADGDFADGGHFDPFWQVFKTILDVKFRCAIDVVQIF
jgi:hypothetical protein